MQAFINTARKIYEKIEQGVFDVSNEVPNCPFFCPFACSCQAYHGCLPHIGQSMNLKHGLRPSL
jgi:hypothetical protein